MSYSIEDLYDYELVKRCYRCESVCLKTSFHNKTKKNGLNCFCKF